MAHAGVGTCVASQVPVPIRRPIDDSACLDCKASDYLGRGGEGNDPPSGPLPMSSQRRPCGEGQVRETARARLKADWIGHDAEQAE